MQIGKQCSLRTILENEKGKVRCESEGILRKFSCIKAAFMTSFGKAMKNLQDEYVDISTAVEMYYSLTMLLNELETSFPIYKDSAEEKMHIRNSESVPSCSAVKIQRPKRQIKRKRFFDELSESEKEPESPEKETLSDCDEMCRIMKVVYLILSSISLQDVGFKENIVVYPNVYTTLKIHNCTPATNYSSEKSFSGLKSIKNYLLTAQNQERLVYLGVLAIESDMSVSLDFEEVIITFDNVKVRW
ncbi:hypothetical protein PR048_003919, partial [Dryococelus australis]